jgi:hypothetical protein
MTLFSPVFQKYALTNPFREHLSPLESQSQFDDTVTFTQDDETVLNLDFHLDVELPIHAYEEIITQTIRENQCVVLTGSTGCGKVKRLLIIKIKVVTFLNICRPRNFQSSLSRIAKREPKISMCLSANHARSQPLLMQIVSRRSLSVRSDRSLDFK